MNFCLYCQSQIPLLTKGGKERTFCNKSCSRKHYIENNREKVVKSNKKGFQTTKEKLGEDFLKHRGRSTVKKREAHQKMKEEGHYHKMSELGNTVRKEKGNSEEQLKKRKETMIEKGLWVNPNLFDFEEWKHYRRVVRGLTLRLFEKCEEGFEWDHIVPLKVGFELQIPPSLLCSEENLQRLTVTENRSKGSNLTQKGKELLEKWGYSD